MYYISKVIIIMKYPSVEHSHRDTELPGHQAKRSLLTVSTEKENLNCNWTLTAKILKLIKSSSNCQVEVVLKDHRSRTLRRSISLS